MFTKNNKIPSQIFSVGGGKGGVGKSIFSISLAVFLVRKGYKVVIADLDLGAANLHTYLGILKKTPTLADFILKKTSSLEDILVQTTYDNMYLISGAEFVPGMANPNHWIKMKIMTHLKGLPVDFIIIDLGGGVHYNTLDFFGLSDRGFVVSVPEPGAIMNAYAFIKGAFFRKLHNIFKKHPIIGPMIQSEMQKNEKENRLTLDWFTTRINEIDPELLSLIYEIENTFQPAFVSNRSPEGSVHLLVKNLINLCNQQLGITIKNIANIPDVKTISNYLLNLPLFFETPDGIHFFESIQDIFQKFDLIDNKFIDTNYFRDDFSDEETEAIIGFLDTLDESVFEGTNKNLWKFRMYYRPSDVLKFLATRGINYDLLYNNRSKSIESSP